MNIDEGIGNPSDSILTQWNQVFSGIKSHIKKISHGCKEFPECKGFPECKTFCECKVNYDNNFDKIKFVSDDSLPLGKSIYFPTLTAVIRCVLKQGDIFYSQVYL